jgi:hypothetical protein
MMLIKTQVPGALFQAIDIKKRPTFCINRSEHLGLAELFPEPARIEP